MAVEVLHLAVGLNLHQVPSLSPGGCEVRQLSHPECRRGEDVLPIAAYHESLITETALTILLGKLGRGCSALAWDASGATAAATAAPPAKREA